MLDAGSISADCGSIYEIDNVNNTFAGHDYTMFEEFKDYNSSDVAVDTIDPDHNITLFAQWTAETYKIYYYVAVGSLDDKNGVNTINEYHNLVNGLETDFTNNYRLWEEKVQTVTYGEMFTSAVKPSERDNVPLHYDFHSWFRWYNNFDEDTGRPDEGDENRTINGYDYNIGDKYHNVFDWYDIGVDTTYKKTEDDPGGYGKLSSEYALVDGNVFDTGIWDAGYFNDVSENAEFSLWFNPSKTTAELSILGDYKQTGNNRCDVSYINLDYYKVLAEDYTENYLDYDLFSTDKFISAETQMKKVFAGDEYFFAYNIKEKYYADFYDANLNPITSYDENGVDKGHYFVTPIVHATEDPHTEMVIYSETIKPELPYNYVYYETTYNEDEDYWHLDKTDMVYASYAENYYWAFDAYAYVNNGEEMRVPSWYEHIGWYVQLDQEQHYIINDDYYGYDLTKSTQSKYFNYPGADRNSDGEPDYYYHNYEYEYTGMDGSIKTANSEFYYYTDNNNKVVFTFTHAYCDIFVYAVYKTVEYSAEVTINGANGATYWTSNGVAQVNNPDVGVNNITLNSDINASDSYNTNGVVYGDRANYKGSYYQTGIKFPLTISVDGAGNVINGPMVDYSTDLFTYSNNNGVGGRGTSGAATPDDNRLDDKNLFVNTDSEIGRRAFDDFIYGKLLQFKITT